jgi:hypothetical protein
VKLAFDTWSMVEVEDVALRVAGDPATDDRDDQHIQGFVNLDS